MAFGAADGAFQGDIQRRKLALAERQQAFAEENAAVSADQRQQELNMRAQSQRNTTDWSNVINNQRVEAENLRMQQMQKQLDEFDRVGQLERKQLQERQEAANSNMGVALISAVKNGGFLLNSQVEAFNQQNGTQFTHIGTTNPLTGDEYEDKGFHLVQVGKDKVGNPTLVQNNTLSPDFVRMTIESNFGKVALNPNYGKSAGNGVEIAKINAASREKVAAMKNDTHIESMIASSMNKLRDMKNIAGSPRFSDEQLGAFEQELRDKFSGFMSSAKNDASESSEYGAVDAKVGDVIGRVTKQGALYEVYIGDDGKKHARKVNDASGDQVKNVNLHQSSNASNVKHNGFKEQTPKKGRFVRDGVVYESYADENGKIRARPVGRVSVTPSK